MPPNPEQPLVTPKDIKPPVYSADQLRAINDDMLVLNSMRDQRDRPHPELDGMTYVEYYESNRKKDLSYIPPKREKNDIRIVTGHTRSKDTTLLSTALDMNLQPSITAFDTEDMIVAELGDNMGDVVFKSRQLEDWDKKRPIIYREMIAQGDVFVQEVEVDDFRYMPLTDVDWDPTRDGISEFSFQERLKKLYSGCAARMVNGKKIYMGNIRTEYIEDQEAVAVMNIYSRARAFSMYGAWERWKNIPTTIDTTQFFALDGTTYKSWNLVRLANQDQVAEIFLYQPKKNRVQIYNNGIPMLPHNYPLTALFPSGEIPIAQGKLGPISDFAYSKGQPAEIKIDQEVLDETTKLMIEGMRQGRKPPMGNKTRKVFGSNIFQAGKVTPDVPEGSLYPLLENAGLNSADFSFYNLIRQAIEDKTINKSFEGDSKEENTLGQAQQDKEQQMMKLGAALDGFVNLERRMVWNRLYNVIKNYTEEIDTQIDTVKGGVEKVYKTFAVSTTVEDGKKGHKVFRFTPSDKFPKMKDHIKEEKKLSEAQGLPVRIVYMDPDALRSIKYTWFVVINPTPKSGDKLTQLMFVQHVQQAIEIFGPDALNLEYVKQRYSIVIDEDYSKFFNKVDAMQALMMQAGMGPEVPGTPSAPVMPAPKGGASAVTGAAPAKAIPSRTRPTVRAAVR